MKISILKTFTTAVEQKSLSRAADLLYLTQPAVSKQIKMLEKYFNVQLFHRQGQKVSLTEGGEVLYKQAKEIIKKWEHSRQLMSELSDKVGGVLRIGASTIPGEYLLPYLLGSYRHHYPEVEIKVEIGDTGEIVKKLLSEEVHIGIVGAPVERKKLTAKKFARDNLVLIIPLGHPLAQKEKIYPRDLINQDLVWREKGSGTRKVVEEKLLSAGLALESLQPILEMGSTQSIITAVSAGLGISFVSAWAVCREAIARNLVKRNVEGISLQRDLYFLYPKEQYLPRSAVKFLDFSHQLDIPASLKRNVCN